VKFLNERNLKFSSWLIIPDRQAGALMLDYHPYMQEKDLYQPTALTILTTERCTNHCPHCLFSSTEEGREIDPQIFEHIISTANEVSHVTHLHLFGGEPFLNLDLLLKLLKITAQSDKKYIGIPTNCFWGNSEASAKTVLDQVAQTLPNGKFLNLFLSVDSQHQQKVGMANVANIVLAWLKNDYRNIQIHLNTFIHNKDFETLLNLLNLLKQMGISIKIMDQAYDGEAYTFYISCNNSKIIRIRAVLSISVIGNAKSIFDPSKMHLQKTFSTSACRSQYCLFGTDGRAYHDDNEYINRRDEGVAVGDKSLGETIREIGENYKPVVAKLWMEESESAGGHPAFWTTYE